MTGTDILFANRKIKIDRLLPFGFAKNEKGYFYSTNLADGQFEMIVTVTKNGNVSAEVIDRVSGEGYILHRVSSAQGAFVGKVREEYKDVLTAIAEACFENNIFKSEYAGHIIQYVRKKYQDELQFLWTKFPNNAVFRRKDTAKWYAALLIVQRKKLGMDENGTVEIIDLRIKPENINILIDKKKYFPGYHMNKKHWFTVCLDGSVPIKEIFSRIDESFLLAEE